MVLVGGSNGIFFVEIVSVEKFLEVVDRDTHGVDGDEEGLFLLGDSFLISRELESGYLTFFGVSIF